MKRWLSVVFAVAVLVIGTVVGVSLASAKTTSDHRDTTSGRNDDDDHGRGDRQLCGLDIVWLKMSAEGDLFEIRGGQIALAKSQNRKVRVLAQTLIKDHTQSLRDVKELASELGVQLPSEPSPSQQWELEEVAEMSGTTFDHDYSELEVKDHMQDIDEAKDEVELGCDRRVRDEARKELPTLRDHLKLAQDALQASGSDD